MRLWKEAGIDPKTAGGDWYRDTGSGMGPTLNTAAAMDGYTLSDRGTWLSFKNKQNLTIVAEGDRRLFNQYGVMLVSPAKHPHVKQDLGRKFIDWLISADGQKTIADYKISGAQLFFPNAKSSHHERHARTSSPSAIRASSRSPSSAPIRGVMRPRYPNTTPGQLSAKMRLSGPPRGLS